MIDEKVTIYDDGLDTEGLQVPFDFEGVPKKKVTFLTGGWQKRWPTTPSPRVEKGRIPRDMV